MIVIIRTISKYVLNSRKQFSTESSFPNCSFKTGLGFEAMLSTYILYAQNYIQCQAKKVVVCIHIRAQNVVLHFLTLSSFTCLPWYDLFGV